MGEFQMNSRCPWEFRIRDHEGPNDETWVMNGRRLEADARRRPGPANDGPEGDWLIYDTLEEAVDACYLHPDCKAVYDNSCTCSGYKLCAAAVQEVPATTIPDEDNGSCTYTLTERDLLWPPCDRRRFEEWQAAAEEWQAD